MNLAITPDTGALVTPGAPTTALSTGMGNPRAAVVLGPALGFGGGGS